MQALVIKILLPCKHIHTFTSILSLSLALALSHTDGHKILITKVPSECWDSGLLCEFAFGYSPFMED